MAGVIPRRSDTKPLDEVCEERGAGFDAGSRAWGPSATAGAPQCEVSWRPLRSLIVRRPPVERPVREGPPRLGSKPGIWESARTPFPASAHTHEQRFHRRGTRLATGLASLRRRLLGW